jgi:hypothetical protein
MPNWVYNGLTVEGNPEQINKMVTQLNKPYKSPVKTHGFGDLSFGVDDVLYPNPVFSFHNIYSYVDHGVSDEEYIQQPPMNTPDFSDFLKFETNDWYNFNNREWGTKWDVAVRHDEEYPDTYMEGPTENGENLVVYYNFNTAWSVPIPALSKLSKQYPTLLFTLSFEEETGWGGELEILRGEVISESTYGWQCRECEHQEEDTPYCEDCDFDMCPACGYGEPMDEDRAKCQTHAVQLTKKENMNV